MDLSVVQQNSELNSTDDATEKKKRFLKIKCHFACSDKLQFILAYNLCMYIWSYLYSM